MMDKSLIVMGEDGPAQRAGSPSLDGGNSPENPIYQGALAGTDYTARDASTRNDSATERADTGKIRGMCSPGVLTIDRDTIREREQRALALRATTSLYTAEVDSRLSAALFDAGRSALGMPGTVDTFKAMLHRAGLALVLA